MRTWRHSGFHVYVGPSILTKEDAVRVGLYIVRAPASASRLQLAEGGLLKYLAKGSLPNDRCGRLISENVEQAIDFIWRDRGGLRLQPDWQYPAETENESLKKWTSDM